MWIRFAVWRVYRLQAEQPTNEDDGSLTPDQRQSLQVGQQTARQLLAISQNRLDSPAPGPAGPRKRS